jgi:hypothetical protein
MTFRVWLRNLLAYGVLPNLAFAVLGHFVFLPGWVAGLLFGLVFLNDVVVNTASIFHFQLADFFKSTGDAIYLNWRYFLPTLFAIFIGTVVLSVASVWLRGPGAKALKDRLKVAAGLFTTGFVIAFGRRLFRSSIFISPIQRLKERLSRSKTRSGIATAKRNTSRSPRKNRRWGHSSPITAERSLIRGSR